MDWYECQVVDYASLVGNMTYRYVWRVHLKSFCCVGSHYWLWNAACISAGRMYPGHAVLLRKALPLCQHLPIECRMCIPSVGLREWNRGLARVGVLPRLQQSQDFTASFWISSSPFSPVWHLEKIIPDLQRKLEMCYFLSSYLHNTVKLPPLSHICLLTVLYKSMPFIYVEQIVLNWNGSDADCYLSSNLYS